MLQTAGIASVTAVRQILVVSHDQPSVRELRRELTGLGVHTIVASTMDEAKLRMSIADWDAVFLDQGCGDVLRRGVQSYGAVSPVVVLADLANAEGAVDMLRRGADDVLVKPVSTLALHACLVKLERLRLRFPDRPTDRPSIQSKRPFIRTNLATGPRGCSGSPFTRRYPNSSGLLPGKWTLRSRAYLSIMVPRRAGPADCALGRRAGPPCMQPSHGL